MQTLFLSVRSYKNLIVWQKSMELVCELYELTELFPRQETYGLVSQMRKCAVSIPSNIAEGRRRGTEKDFLKFLRYAFGSGGELETQIEISKRLFSTRHLNYEKVDTLLDEVMRMLNTLITKQ